MTPDWYVDPLGRYEGRYFDGEQWTAQVKDRGRLVIDPDWDRPEVDPDAADDTASVDDTIDDTTDQSFDGGFDEPGRAAVEPITPAPTIDPAPVLDPVDETAVTAGQVDFSQESPARQVAVLDSPDPEPVSETIAVDEEPSGSRRWLYVLGLAVLALALLLILLPRLLSNDETADADDQPIAAVDDADAAEDTGEDAADPADEGALPATEAEDDTNEAMADEDADADAMDDGDTGAMDDEAAEDDAAQVDDNSDALTVGSLEILNAKPVLRDLAVWHESSLTGRDITLGDDADCWLGSIGEAVVQNAHCGPVAATPGAEPRFDLVPLRFEDVSEGVIQIRPVTDAVVIDSVLPNGLELVGRDGPIDPASFAPSVDASDNSTEDTSAEDADGSEADGDEADSDRGARGGRDQGD
jgi:hypothetical protein